MVSKYDLYDLSAVLVNIRSDIQYELNSVILSKVIEVLKLNDQTFQDNQVRKALASIKSLDQERWYFVYHNNQLYLQQRRNAADQDRERREDLLHVGWSTVGFADHHRRRYSVFHLSR